MDSAEIFIGREAELKRLRQDVFFVKPGSHGYCYSLVGLNDIGKTFLIRKLTEEFREKSPENAFCFSTEVSDGTSYWLFWARLVVKFSKTITAEALGRTQENWVCDNTEEILEIYKFFNENLGSVNTEEFRSQAIIYLSELFLYYTEMGIRIILTIDEFDRAREVFQDGQFFQFLFGLTPKGALTPLNLSIITLSRRKVSTIAHHMQEGSYFEDAFPPIVLKGFNDKELEEYFNSYAELDCGVPEKEAQEEILYLCGRSPGLLMEMRHEFEFLDSASTDIGYVYAERGQFIKTAYNRMLTLMETSYADRAHEKPILEVFVQKFIGPVYDENFEMLLPLLYDHGFVTKGTADNNIFLQSGRATQGEGVRAGSANVFEPLAPYFIEYIKHLDLPNSLANLSGMLTKAEKLVRGIIENEMKKAFPDTWEELVNAYAGKKDHFLEALQVKVLQNDFTAGSISKLNVISFKEYYYIIKDHWAIFEKYFKAYKSIGELEAAMTMLSESRNTSAHLNLAVYNAENRRKLRETCDFFIDCLEKPQTAPPQVQSDAAQPTQAQIDALMQSGETVTFCCQAIKQPKGNLRGILKGYGFAAGVAQRNLEAFGFVNKPRIGDEFAAVVEKWDANAQIFNLKAPE